LASILSGEHNLAAIQCTHSKIPLQAVNKLVKLLFRKSLDKLTFGSNAFVLCNIQQNQTINKPCTHYCHYLSLSLSLSASLQLLPTVVFTAGGVTMLLLLILTFGQIHKQVKLLVS